MQVRQRMRSQSAQCVVHLSAPEAVAAPLVVSVNKTKLIECSTSHPPQQKDAVHSCAPARGRGPAPAQDCCVAPHGRLCSDPAAPRPDTAAPHDTSPDNNNKTGGNEDILSSATGPSTTRCSKDVTTHQHRPGACPGRSVSILNVIVIDIVTKP
jgi:hypothetical protein